MIEYVHPEQLPKLTLEIAKPNREVIGRIKDAFNRKQRIKLGQINEIDFVVPFMKIDETGNLSQNPIINKLKSQYHIRATFGEQVEWFIVSNLQKSTSEDGKSFLSVQLKSLGYQLKNKRIKMWAGVHLNGEYVKESLNAKQVVNDLLSNSAWSVSYIDSEFLTKYRSFDFSGTTILDALFNVAETFGAIILWDTVNKAISLVKQENVGINKGFRVSERKYMKSIDKEEKSDEIVTRLRVYGQDGLSINRVNPLGTDYIEDLSYFMQGFERDANKTVLSSSEYMSDSLCNALLDYQSVILSNKGVFDNLLSQKETLEGQKITKDTELINLETQLKVVLNTIDLKQSTGTDASAELAQKATLEGQIATKKSEIATVISQINSIDIQIRNLKNTLSVENNFTADQILELDNYIYEEEWEDQNYTNDLELYNDALKVFEDLRKPKEIISTNIVNIFKLLEGKKDWERFNIGDKFHIDYERFGIDVETQLIELEIDHDGLDINVTFANTKDIERDEDKLSKILYKSISSGNRVNMGKYKWDQIHNVQTSVDDILEGKWNPATNGINAGNQTVLIDERGITTINKNDPNKFVRMTHGGLGFTNTGGNDYKTFVDATGVYAEHLVGKIVITENLYVENEDASYSMDGNGFTITSRGDDGKKRVILDVDSGLKFQTKVNGVYQDKLYYDSVNERLVVEGEGDFNELKVNGVSVLTSDKQKIDSQHISNLTADQITTGTLTGVVVNVTTDVKVGQNLYVGQSTLNNWFDSSSIIFGGGAKNAEIIGTTTGDLTLKAKGGLGGWDGRVISKADYFHFEGNTNSTTFISGDLNFSNANVSGLNVTVSFG